MISRSNNYTGKDPEKAQLRKDLDHLNVLINAYNSIHSAVYKIKFHPIAKTQQGLEALQLHTDHLPTVDRVRIVAIAHREETSPKTSCTSPGGDEYSSFGQRLIKGKDAEAIAKLWRELTFNATRGSMCHTPPYALRFESKGKVLFETTVCWECENFEVIGDDGRKSWYGFIADDNKAKALLDKLRKTLPNPLLERALLKGGGQ